MPVDLAPLDTTPLTKHHRRTELPTQLSKSATAMPSMAWQGEITTLAAGAIVNAATAQLLGCFIPFHACIDNAIHATAGPRLREDCARIMRLQGCPEPVRGGEGNSTSNVMGSPVFRVR